MEDVKETHDDFALWQALAIRVNAHHAAKAIMDKRAALDRAGLSHMPLVVLAGESHHITTHHLHHLAVLQQLKGREPALGVAYEFEHNRTAQEFVMSGRPLPPANAAKLATANDNGGLSLRTSYRPILYGCALHTRPLLFRFIQKSGLAFCFNDVARPHQFTEDGTPLMILDINDKSTARSIINAGYDATPGIDARSLKGVDIRNDHMVRHAIAFAQKHKLRILFQQCGMSHVAGSVQRATGHGTPPEEDNHLEEFSLSRLFKNPGMPILTIWPTDRMFTAEKIIEHTTLADDEVIVSRDIAYLSAVYDSILSPDEDEEFFLTSREDEASFVNRVLTHMGMPEHTMTVEEFHHWRAQSEREKEAVFDSIAPLATPAAAAQALIR